MTQSDSKTSRSELDQKTIALIEQIAAQVRANIDHGRLPEISLPVRSLENVIYDLAKGYFELGGAHKTRTLTTNTARSFAQTLRMMALSRTMVEHDDFATKREVYYISKNWGDCRFDEQVESDAVMDDIEASASVEGLAREQLRFYPEAHGGSVAGRLTVIDRNSATGETVEIDCSRLGSGAYSIPRSVEHLWFRTDARFILAIETGGMFQRLNNHRFWETAGCIIIEMGGVPTRATRRFIRLLSDNEKLPVYCFVDCDPYGFTNIYRTLKVGSGNAAHVNRFLCVPQARFLGVTPQDIVDFGLRDATHPLSATDVKRAEDALENDPFVKAHPAWIAAIKQQLSMGVRAEQQALAKWGLNYVIKEYLPKKLSNPESFLP
ncbi:MAG: DNA topoisomerase IV subunit A [Bradyrhizobium sp.]|uniref:DNA topoisomerase IV subunit A n=1 Tax=Bradyrhizobium sp. TaxID=376 RepID=UPI0025BAE0A3|nr:DNA topoisomerase IV subunit A [Bradyrhizobium sp.]MBI5265090.1 DNA topoisomerase IV subunit A [Bradyrhizobium sp.]